LWAWGTAPNYGKKQTFLFNTKLFTKQDKFLQQNIFLFKNIFIDKHQKYI